jgi:hypothetical protein
MMRNRLLSIRNTPLCPAGHLPLKGGDRQVAIAWTKITRPMTLPGVPRFTVGCDCLPNPISPLEGEMPGRAEGGNFLRQRQSFSQKIRQEAIHAPRS